MLTFGLVFWLLMFLWVLYGAWGWYTPAPHWIYGHGLFLFILFFLLGWKVYGVPIRP